MFEMTLVKLFKQGKGRIKRLKSFVRVHIKNRIAATLNEARARRFEALLDAIPPDRRTDVLDALTLLATATRDLEDPRR